jgi:hypothetical protein
VNPSPSTASGRGNTGDVRTRASQEPRPGVWLYVASVSFVGAALLAMAFVELPQLTLTPWVAAFSLLTVIGSRFRIKVPGHPATVSVPEVFVFGSILLYGPVPAMLTGAMDGLLISRRQKNRRLYRTLFNIAEPAISIAGAACAFLVTRALLAGWSGPLPSALTSELFLPTMAMATTYLALNSVLIAAAVAIENAVPIAALWKNHALYLAMNYYAAASIAVLVFTTEGGLNVAGLVVPLLALSFAAYQAVTSRIEDSARHVREV